MAIQASKANEAIQTILDQKITHVIPPYNNHYSKYGIDILIQGKLNHILYKGQGISEGNRVVLKGYLPNLLETALCHQIFVF